MMSRSSGLLYWTSSGLKASESGCGKTRNANASAQKIKPDADNRHRSAPRVRIRTLIQYTGRPIRWRLRTSCHVRTCSLRGVSTPDLHELRYYALCSGDRTSAQYTGKRGLRETGAGCLPRGCLKRGRSSLQAVQRPLVHPRFRRRPETLRHPEYCDVWWQTCFRHSFRRPYQVTRLLGQSRVTQEQRIRWRRPA
jgi:hypothetical protein